MHLAYIWIVSHLSAKNYRNLWKFDEVLTKTNLLSFFWDTLYSLYDSHECFLPCSQQIVEQHRNRGFGLSVVT